MVTNSSISVRNRTKKLVRIFYQIICRILMLPVAVLVLFSGIVRRVRIGYFTSDRVGHFIFDFFWYRDQIQDHRRYFDIFFFVGRSSNLAFERIVRREIRVWSWAEHAAYWLQLYEAIRQKHILDPARVSAHSRDPRGKLDGDRNLEDLFSESESDQVSLFLKKYGLNPTDKFVCYVVRDAGYLAHVSGKPPGHWDYHSYRNSEIKDFECSARAIADRGYFVFRVGRFNKQIFRSGIPRVVDLSGDEELDDLIDIWLLAHCAFVVTTGTGIDTMALCLGRPMLFVNFLPIMHTWSWHYTMTYPKRLTWVDTGVELTFEEYVQNSWQRTQAYRDAGIRVDSLLPKEIRDAVIEFDDRLIEKRCETPKEATLQTAAWQCVLSNSDKVASHQFIHPKACFASAFLLSTSTKKNRNEGSRRRN